MRPSHPIIDLVFTAIGFESESYNWDGMLRSLGLDGPEQIKRMNKIELQLKSGTEHGYISAIYDGVRVVSAHFTFGRSEVCIERRVPSGGWCNPYDNRMSTEQGIRAFFEELAKVIPTDNSPRWK